jgi:hypothetical protein
MGEAIPTLATRPATIVLICSLLSACAAVDIASPGAQGLTAEQSAWIISDDDVQIVSLDGNVLHAAITIANDAFLDGVRDKLRVEPGVHEVVVRMDNGMYRMKDGTPLRLDTRAATTYHITVEYGPPLNYEVRQYAGIPDKNLLKQLDDWPQSSMIGDTFALLRSRVLAILSQVNIAVPRRCMSARVQEMQGLLLAESEHAMAVS